MKEITITSSAPEATEPEENIIGYTDHILGTITSLEPAVVHAEQKEGKEEIEWIISHQPSIEEQEKLDSIKIPKRLFRPFLARVGHHYLNNQLYEGFSVLGVNFKGREYVMRVFMGNHGFTGFFIRIGIHLKSQPGEVVNASQPAGLSENHLHG